MGDYKTTLTTSIIEGDHIELAIRISKTDDTEFSLNNPLKVENIFKIIQVDSFEVKMGKSKSTKSNMILKDGVFSYNPSALKKSNYFEISIKGSKQSTFTDSEILQIILQTSDGTTETLTCGVFYKKSAPKIKKFLANNYTIQEGRGKDTTISIEIDGECTTRMVMLNNREFTRLDQSKMSITIVENDLAPGINECNLRLTTTNEQQKEVVICQSLYINKIEKSEVKSRSIAGGKIINFCVSQDGNYLFALVLTDDHLKIAFTDQPYGDNVWYDIEINDTNPVSVRNYENSPMVHLINEDERKKGELGRIFLVGGSMIGHINVDHAQGVAILRLGDTTQPVKPEIKDSVLPDYVLGHTCVVFPEGNNPHTIWLMGGQNNFGNGNDHIWTSSDGFAWNIHSKAPWQSRIMPGATVRLDDKMNAHSIWLGGGYEDFASDGGVFKDDCWEWNEGQWKDVLHLNPEKAFKAFSIAYEGKESANHTGLLTLGFTNNAKFFETIDTNHHTHKYDLTPLNVDLNLRSPNQGMIITAYFKQSLWFMRIYDEGHTVNYTDLLYRIPTIHETSLPLFKN